MRKLTSEAAKYTPEMWANLTGRMVHLAIATASERRGFSDGFNGLPKAHHHKARSMFDLGRHVAIMLGYIKDPRP